MRFIRCLFRNPKYDSKIKDNPILDENKNQQIKDAFVRFHKKIISDHADQYSMLSIRKRNIVERRVLLELIDEAIAKQNVSKREKRFLRKELIAYIDSLWADMEPERKIGLL